jgi:hypothetical protein
MGNQVSRPIGSDAIQEIATEKKYEMANFEEVKLSGVDGDEPPQLSTT